MMLEYVQNRTSIPEKQQYVMVLLIRSPRVSEVIWLLMAKNNRRLRHYERGRILKKRLAYSNGSDDTQKFIFAIACTTISYILVESTSQ